MPLGGVFKGLKEGCPLVRGSSGLKRGALWSVLQVVSRGVPSDQHCKMVSKEGCPVSGDQLSSGLKRGVFSQDGGPSSGVPLNKTAVNY